MLSYIPQDRQSFPVVVRIEMSRFTVVLVFICMSIACSSDVNAEAAIESGFVAVDGGKLYYESAGDGKPVVLIHGFTLDRRMWDAEFEALSEDFRVIRYDLRGHGKSSSVEKEFTHIDDLHALLKELGLTKVQLIGLSLGGEIACNFSIAYPEQVQSAVLIDPYYPLQDNAPKFAFNRRISEHISLGRQQGIKAGLTSWLSDPLFEPACEDKRLKEKLEDIVITGHGSHGEKSLFLSFKKKIESDKLNNKSLSDVRCPILFLIGERDLPRFHAVADYFADRVPSISVVEVPKAGHMANMENPSFVMDQINSFLMQ